MIGNIKQEGMPFGLCWFKGIGDQLNGMLTGVGQNFEADSQSNPQTTKAKKAKEFFDPNFIPTAGGIFIKNF